MFKAPVSPGQDFDEGLRVYGDNNGIRLSPGPQDADEMRPNTLHSNFNTNSTNSEDQDATGNPGAWHYGTKRKFSALGPETSCNQEVTCMPEGWNYSIKRKFSIPNASDFDVPVVKRHFSNLPSTYAQRARRSTRRVRRTCRFPFPIPINISDNTKRANGCSQCEPGEELLLPLFEDVSTVFRPTGAGHDEFEQDVEMRDQYLVLETLTIELLRAEQLSHKPISNAPPYHVDLPWDDLIDNCCTIEELIIFFPNHVLRWPVLALCLRKMEWDRMFERTAWLINRSRDRHQYPRDDQNAEALPCMLKAERAIKELEPNFSFDDWESHYAHISPDMTWLKDNKTRKPKTFPQVPVRTVSVVEAASWVTYNPFFNNKFSQHVLKLCDEDKRRQIKETFILQTERVPSAPRQEHRYQQGREWRRDQGSGQYAHTSSIHNAANTNTLGNLHGNRNNFRVAFTDNENNQYAHTRSFQDAARTNQPANSHENSDDLDRDLADGEDEPNGRATSFENVTDTYQPENPPDHDQLFDEEFADDRNDDDLSRSVLENAYMPAPEARERSPRFTEVESQTSQIRASSSGVLDERPKKDCRNGANCTNPYCWFAHPVEDWNGTSRPQTQATAYENPDSRSPLERCRWGLECNKINDGCRFDHSAPAAERNGFQDTSHSERIKSHKQRQKQQKQGSQNQNAASNNMKRDRPEKSQRGRGRLDQIQKGGQGSQPAYADLIEGHEGRNKRGQSKGRDNRGDRGGQGGQGGQDGQAHRRGTKKPRL